MKTNRNRHYRQLLEREGIRAEVFDEVELELMGNRIDEIAARIDAPVLSVISAIGALHAAGRRSGFGSAEELQDIATQIADTVFKYEAGENGALTQANETKAWLEQRIREAITTAAQRVVESLFVDGAGRRAARDKVEKILQLELLKPLRERGAYE